MFDCLGRTLDWLYVHDPTKLFAGIACRARQVFGVSTAQVHVDTTSFSVSGDYAVKQAQEADGEGGATEVETDLALIAITYSYSRDHREDLKQWMLALATTHEGDMCLLVYRLAEFRLRVRFVETAQTIPDQGLQTNRTSDHAALVFQCFEGIELLHIHTPFASRTLVLRLQPVHQLILSLLGSTYEQFYLSSG